jgi:hypothetical protein
MFLFIPFERSKKYGNLDETTILPLLAFTSDLRRHNQWLKSAEDMSDPCFWKPQRIQSDAWA